MYSFFSSDSGLFFFSLSLALLTEARLLCLISISSTLSALETVNLKSLLSIGVLSFSLLFPVGFSSFFMKAFVACCSINFLLNFLFLCSVFLNPGLESNGFLLPFDCLKEVFLSFEIEKVFLLSLFLKELESILFLKFEDIVNVFFLSLLLSIHYLKAMFLADIIKLSASSRVKENSSR